MADKERIGIISVIKDDDCGMYKVGEVEGGFDPMILDEWMEKETFRNSLFQHLSYLQFQAFEALRRYNMKKSINDNLESSKY